MTRIGAFLLVQIVLSSALFRATAAPYPANEHSYQARGYRHSKLSADSGSLAPVNRATVGNGHSGRVLPGKAAPVAMILSGFSFRSTQDSMARSESNWSVARPPEQ